MEPKKGKPFFERMSRVFLSNRLLEKERDIFCS
jgi:hypothetical protein